MEMCLSPECICSGVCVCWLMECGGCGLGWVWGSCGAPPLCLDCGWEGVPGASGGYTLVRVGGAWDIRGQSRDMGTRQLSLFCSSQGKEGFNPSH